MNPTSSGKISPYAREVAKQLLKLDVIEFKVKETFTWASGIVSPIYCDNRKINSDVEARNLILDIFIRVISQYDRDVELIAGVATGGIPMGVLIADRMNLPFVYVRQAPKGHGLKRQVEGSFKSNSKVILIEDHISTGGSSLKAVEGLRNSGLNMLALISIMTYGFPEAVYNFNEHDVNYLSLCDLDTILEVAYEDGKISEEEKKSISLFRMNPNDWVVNH